MRMTTLALFGVLGLAASVASVNAAPRLPAMPTTGVSNIVAVSSCGYGLHRNARGFCVRNRHHYRPYAYRYYRPYPRYRYYGGGYAPWYGPSPSDYVANQLNAQELGRHYYGY